MEWHDRIGRKLRLRDLHTLLAVAEFGSMAKAAVHLAVTQPAISKAISDMEHTLGVRLLDRTARGVEPTAHGRVLLRHGLAAFEDLRGAVKELEFLSDPEAGELRVGASQAMMGGLLSEIVDRLTRRYPRLTFHIETAASVALLYRDLRERNLELVLGRLVPTLVVQEDVDNEILGEEPSFIVAGAGSRWARRRKVSTGELASAHWCLPSPSTLPGSYAMQAFRQLGVEFPKRLVLANSLQMHCALLATGRFLGLMPKSFLRFNAKRLGLKVLPISVPVKTPPIAVLRLRNRPLSPMAERFVACAKELAA